MKKYINKNLGWSILLKRLNKLIGRKAYFISQGELLFQPQNEFSYSQLVMNIRRGVTTIEEKNNFIRDVCSTITRGYDRFQDDLVVKTDFWDVADRG